MSGGCCAHGVLIEGLESRQLLAGDGLSAVYYDGATLAQAQAVQGATATTIVSNLAGNTVVDGNWGSGRPAVMATGDADTWSARFTGDVETLPAAGPAVYTFRTYSDDGVRLWVDGQLIIDAWTNHTPRYDAGTITLEGSKKYQIRLEYYDNTSGAALKLEWNRPGLSAGTFEAVPQANLYSGTRAFPVNLNMVNVKNFGAVGDGITDDWRAIQTAISSIAGNTNTVSKVLYFPNGTYKVSRQLEWRKYKVDAGNQFVPDTATWGGWRGYVVLQGESRGNTVIRLADNTYTSTPTENSDANWAPNAVLYTASSDSINGYSDINGEGNMAFLNGARDLTINVGSGNTGAVGISYQTSNQGQLRDVNILSDNGSGHAGLRMERNDNGPGLVKNLLVTGFKYGIQGPSYAKYSNMSFEHLVMRGQTVAALNVPGGGPTWSFRDLRSINSVPGFTYVRNASNTPRQGNIVIIDSSFTGGQATAIGVNNPDASGLFIRNTVFSGYGTSVRSTVAGLTSTRTGNVAEFVSHDIEKNFSDSPSGSLNLPIIDTPDYENNNINADWAFVGKPSGSDDTNAIQAALNSNKPVVYFKGWSWYKIRGTLTVPATVRKIVFDYATLVATDSGHSFGSAASPTPFLKILGTTAEPLIIDRAQFRLSQSSASTPGAQAILHDSPRPLVLSSVLEHAVVAHGGYVPTAQAGDVYFEDSVISGLTFRSGQSVWARSLNTEGFEANRIVNDGADLWVLGLKSEKPLTVLRTQNSGRSEVLGGFIFALYKSTQAPTTSMPPAFVNDRGEVAFSYASHGYTNAYDWVTHVRESRDGVTFNNLQATDLPSRGGARTVALYRGSATPLATLRSIHLDDGGEQYSRARSVTLMFDGILSGDRISAGSISLRAASGSQASIGVSIGALEAGGGRTTLRLTFNGPNVDAAAGLLDGRYVLTIDGSLIRDANNRAIDAAGGGVAGSVKSHQFFRLAGDVDGDAAVNFNDFLLLQVAFGSTPSSPQFNNASDFNGDSVVNFNDFLILQTQFGSKLD